MTDPSRSRGSSWLLALILLPVLVLLGMFAGGLIATRLFPSSGMGWDQLANALGGFIVGGAAGLAAWALVLRALGARGSGAALGIAGIVCAVVLGYLVLSPASPRGPAAKVVDEVPPVAPFSFELATAEGFEPAVPGAPRIPWRLLRISSTLSFTFVPDDRPNQLCMVIDPLHTPDGVARLTALRDVLSGLPSDIDCGEPCRSCDDVTVRWSVDQDQGALVINDRCWLTHEQLQSVRAAIDVVVTPYRTQAVCESMPGV